MKLTVLDLGGLNVALEALRLPFEGTSKGEQKDIELGQRLVLQGASHAKFTRLIDVWFRIEAPRYWWAEFDTYRMGVEKVSSSTMHLLGKRPLQADDFEGSFVSGLSKMGPIPQTYLDELNKIILSEGREAYLRLKAMLPESFLQTRIVKVSYQALHSMWLDRHDHRLPAWQAFFRGLRYFDLPYADQLIFVGVPNEHNDNGTSSQDSNSDKSACRSGADEGSGVDSLRNTEVCNDDSAGGQQID